MLALTFCLALAAPLQSDTGLPVLEAREFAPHSTPIRHLRSDAKGTQLFTVEGPGAPEGDSQRQYSPLRAWDVKKEKLLREQQLLGPGIVALDVGDERIATTYGKVVVETNDVESGKKGGGVGGPNLMANSTALVSDPKDRWVWLGTDQGGVTRLNPKDVKGWSQRGVKNGGVTALALDEAGKKLAIGGRDGTVRFVDPVGCQVDDKRSFEVFEDAVATLRYDGKGKRLAVGSSEGGLHVIDEARGKLQLELVGHEAALCAVAFDPKNKQLASGDVSGRVLLWDLKSGEQLATLQCEATGPVAGLVFVGKGETLVGTSGGSSLLAWDLSQL